MVLEALREDMEQGWDSPHIVEFEPWQLRDVDSLFAAFFSEIANALGRDGNDSKARRERLLSYGKSLSFGGSSMKSLGVLAGLTGVPFAKLIELAGEKMKDAAEIAEQGADAITDKSIGEKKTELRHLLQDLDRPILVIIDDIDRLEVEEMLLIFQLVKANADFPNFTYLLLLQRDVDRMGQHGRDYLDKIIQLPIDVPPANGGQRHKLFREGIVSLFNSWNLAIKDDQATDLDLLWTNGLGTMLQHPRDVIRLLNALEFSVAVMTGEAGIEVNLADFIALEALRVQESETYLRLPKIKTFLTNSRRRTYKEIQQSLGITRNTLLSTSGDDQQPGQGEVTEVINFLSPGRNQAGLEILTFVFPDAFWAFGTEDQAKTLSANPRPDSPVRAKRGSYFDRYFALAIPEDQISEAQMKSVLAVTGDRVAFRTQLADFQERNMSVPLLLELSNRTEGIPEREFEPCLTALLDFYESRPRSGFVLRLKRFSTLTT
jgi:predicted KAP-like P-loop ATPase